MSALSFTWKGVSSEEYGIVVTQLPADTGWEARDEAYQVAGLDGALHVQDGALEEAQWMVVFYLPYEQGGTVSAVRTIKSWLRGSGKLTLSDRPGYFYNAHIIDAVSYDAWVQGFHDKVCTVYFTVAPYAYRTDSPEDAEITAGSGTITNDGTAVCKPVWTIYGSGDMTFAVGDQVCELTGVDGHITIDCVHCVCYKDQALLNQKMAGVFPVLDPGANAYAVVGTFTKLVCTPNWRDY